VNLEGCKEIEGKNVPVNTMKANRRCKDITPHNFNLRARGK